MIKTYITQSMMGATLGLSLIREFPDAPGQPPRRQVLHLVSGDATESGSHIHTWHEIDYTKAHEPTFILGVDEAHALMLGLINHFQGVDDQRALRKDYDAERGRVDKMITALIGITSNAEI